MILKSIDIKKEILTPTDSDDPLVITPMPDFDSDLKQKNSASVDLRLGCWFQTCRQNRVNILDIYPDRDKAKVPNQYSLTKEYFTPYHSGFVLHPGAFVLGVTMEWVRLPSNIAAYVIGRSSWGRYGLIIATATGVHPGFTGCLTLELTNVGNVPIKIKPGTKICQLFLHQTIWWKKRTETIDCSSFIGKRKPSLGTIELDKRARLICGLDSITDID